MSSDDEYIPESVLSESSDVDDVDDVDDGEEVWGGDAGDENDHSKLKERIRYKLLKKMLKDASSVVDIEKYLTNMLKNSKKVPPECKDDEPMLILLTTTMSQLLAREIYTEIRKRMDYEKEKFNFKKCLEDMLNEEYAPTSEDDEDYEEEDDEDEMGMSGNGKKFILIYGGKGKGPPNKLDKDKYDENDQKFIDLLDKYNDNGTENKKLEYFSKLGKEEKEGMLETIDKMDDLNETHKPLFFKIMESSMDLKTKAYAFKRLQQLDKLSPHTDDYYKLTMLLTTLIKIPFGKFRTVEDVSSDNKKSVRKFMKRVDKKMSSHVYGHEKTKERIKQIMAKWISNPKSKGNVLGLCGPPGTGKTELLRTLGEKVLDRPFHLISLGGAHDSSFLEGHDYTYIGAHWGRIVECLTKSDCMNPVFFFDELDKVSAEWRGQEITNFLIHLTDPVQNDHFHDKFFGELNFDLSKALFVFSFNRKSKVDHILRDRMEIINVDGYRVNEKMHIVRKHLLPKICEDIGFDLNNLVISDDVISHVVNRYTFEGGVRRVKEHFTNIVLALNKRYLSTGLTLPYTVPTDEIDNEFLKGVVPQVPTKINARQMVGVVNELCAMSIGGWSMGIGELTPTVTTYAPSKESYQLVMTGNLGKMCKESLTVAKSLLWNLIPEKQHNKYFKRWKSSAIHYHAPNIAISKDGPSAGVANIVALVSLVTEVPIRNDVAVTGEVSVDGTVTEIGGLREKADGAKKAGCKLVLCPEQNRNDYVQIKKDKYSPIDETFNIQCISTVWEALDIMLLPNDLVFERFGAGITVEEEYSQPKKRVRTV